MSENTENASDDLPTTAAAAESCENSRKRTHQQTVSGEGQKPESAVEDTCTIADYLSELREQEREARTLLAEASDEHQCTFAGGYVPRQMLYSCLTCARDGNRPVGVCVACSQNCHDDHELIELYSKRRFRCDCGTLRCGAAQKCTMREDETSGQPENVGNIYEHNFDGLYCICHRPYPDPEREGDAYEMIQCNICEDWFHSECLFDKSETGNPNDPSTSSSAADAQSATVDTSIGEVRDVTCGGCAEKYPFLKLIAKKLNNSSSSETNNLPICIHNEMATTAAAGEQATGALIFNQCLQPRLCSCEKCKEFYTLHGVEYLLDIDDVLRTKPNATDAAPTADDDTAADEPELSTFLQSFEPSTQRNMISGYNLLKEELAGFMTSLPAGHVVTKPEVEAFFEELKAKRRRLADDEAALEQAHTF